VSLGQQSQPKKLKDINMLTRIAVAAALVAATSIVSLATEFDPNPANRSAAYAESVGQVTPGTLHSAPVRLSSVATGVITGRPGEIDQYDRASSPYAGGVA
jgi:hypothetical protein